MGIASDMQATLIDGRYFVIELLGRGGMGEVYLARDEEVLGRDVALKVLKKEYAALEEFRERIEREAENAAKLSHPNIVQLLDRGESEDALPYIAMEHMKGGTLAEKIRREGALAWREAARIATQVALALTESHRCGVVHRDIKPHNVFLTGDPLTVVGSVKVGDFGIARAAWASTLTETSMIMGTARYLSPEQAKGEPVGPASDLYSLGITLYQMLTGKVPFEAESPLAIAMRHVSELPPSPREANPDVPEDLAAVTLLLLSKDTLARYGGDALALAEDLERVCRGLKPLYRSVGISPESPTEPLGGPPVIPTRERRVRRRSKKGRLVGATTAAVLALGLPLGGAYSHGLYELPFSYSTNAADQKEIAPAAPSLGSVEVPSPPEEPQDKTSVAYTEPVQEELPAAAPAIAQPVAYTAPVQENPAPVQEELPAAVPAVVEQEAEPVVVQEQETAAPAATVGEKKTQTEPPKEPAVIAGTPAKEDEKPESERGEEQKEEAEERAKDAEKAAKKAKEDAREAQEEAEEERKQAVKEAKERAEEAAEEAQEKAKESAKKRHNAR
jgi:serine/threonine protein kinase